VAVWAATGIVPGLPLPSALATAGATLERVVVISAVFVALYLGLVILLHRGCAPLRQLASLVLEFAPVRRTEALQAATEENYPQPAPR